jgi:hypothetical protein
MDLLSIQTDEDTIRIKKEVDEIIRSVNEEVVKSMKITKEYIKRSLAEAKY